MVRQSLKYHEIIRQILARHKTDSDQMQMLTPSAPSRCAGCQQVYLRGLIGCFFGYVAGNKGCGCSFLTTGGLAVLHLFGKVAMAVLFW